MANELSNMLNTAFAQMVGQMIDQQVAPLREIVHTSAVEIAALQLASIPNPVQYVPSGDAAFLALRIDALFALLGTLIRVDDDAIEDAKRQDRPPATMGGHLQLLIEAVNAFREESFSVKRIVDAIESDHDEEIAKALCAGDQFDEAVVDAIENRSEHVVKAIREDLDDESNIESTIEEVIQRGSFEISFSRR
jgi:hypothetical protein